MRLNDAGAAALAVFSRSPEPGKAKTRLIPLLGERGAAEFHAVLTADTLNKLRPLDHEVALVCLTAGRGLRLSADTPFAVGRQRGRDLGGRLLNAFRRLLRKYERVVIIGADSPELSAGILRRAFRALVSSDAVLGPCPDGGYYLVGLRRLGLRRVPLRCRLPDWLFQGIRWGTPTAFAGTLRNFRREGLSCALLEPLEDIDRPEDLQRLRARMAASASLRRRAPATWRFLRRVSINPTPASAWTPPFSSENPRSATSGAGTKWRGRKNQLF